MILESFKYTKQEGKNNEWILAEKDGNPVQFGNTNLIVGKNAAGKSRTLSAIAEIANILSLKKEIRDIKTSNWTYNIVLKEDNDLYRYNISVQDNIITDEILSINNEIKVNRKEKKIYSELNRKFEPLEIAGHEVIISIKDRKESYPYLDEIFEWGNALRKFTFTNQYEKSHLLDADQLKSPISIDKINSGNVIYLFHEGEKKFGEEFIQSIVSDMKQLDYSISNIFLDYTNSGVGISVYEDELSDSTLQTEMSQGMFRALSFIIQINIALLSKVSVCVLVDDLGEGLDYSRSKYLIDLLIYKINNSNIQLFITTNDRYIMNAIPIKYWSILERSPKKSTFYNYYNSKANFEDFKYTGLNNFDFLATSFYRYGFDNNEQET